MTTDRPGNWDYHPELARTTIARDKAERAFQEAEGAAPLPESPVGYRHGREHESIARESEGAAPRAEGLDWSLIWKAFANATGMGIVQESQDAIRAEYARLSRPSDERVPESEEPR